MKKKNVFLIIGIVLFLIIIFLISRRLFHKEPTIIQNKHEEKIISSIVQDEETGEYIIYNQETGEEIARSENEGDLHIYEIDPDYDPKLPVSDEIIE